MPPVKTSNPFHLENVKDFSEVVGAFLPSKSRMLHQKMPEG
jgi:hypothetical protein